MELFDWVVLGVVVMLIAVFLFYTELKKLMNSRRMVNQKSYIECPYAGENYDKNTEPLK